MGIIRAAASSIADVASEQWKEFFYCDSLPENVLLVRGKKRIGEHSANNREDDGVITNGSIIAVSDGQGAIAVSQGKVIASYEEPGEHVFEDPYHPGGVKGFLKETGNRISFGGGVQTLQQRIYYFNTREIMGIRFSGEIPVGFITGGIISKMSLSGVFSYRVCDPERFYRMVTGNVAMRYDRSRLNEMLISELKTALSTELSQKRLYRMSEAGSYTDDLITALKVSLNANWQQNRGLQIVQIALDGEDFSAADTVAAIDTTKVFSQRDTGQWICSCGAHSSGNFCPECGRARDAAWICSCGMQNKGRFCTNCGKEKIG